MEAVGVECSASSAIPIFNFSAPASPPTTPPDDTTKTSLPSTSGTTSIASAVSTSLAVLSTSSSPTGSSSASSFCGSTASSHTSSSSFSSHFSEAKRSLAVDSPASLVKKSSKARRLGDDCDRRAERSDAAEGEREEGEEAGRRRGLENSPRGGDQNCQKTSHSSTSRGSSNSNSNSSLTSRGGRSRKSETNPPISRSHGDVGTTPTTTKSTTTNANKSSDRKVQKHLDSSSGSSDSSSSSSSSSPRSRSSITPVVPNSPSSSSSSPASPLPSSSSNSRLPDDPHPLRRSRFSNGQLQQPSALSAAVPPTRSAADEELIAASTPQKRRGERRDPTPSRGRRKTSTISSSRRPTPRAVTAVGPTVVTNEKNKSSSGVGVVKTTGCGINDRSISSGSKSNGVEGTSTSSLSSPHFRGRRINRSNTKATDGGNTVNGDDHNGSGDGDGGLENEEVTVVRKEGKVGDKKKNFAEESEGEWRSEEAGKDGGRRDVRNLRSSVRSSGSDSSGKRSDENTSETISRKRMNVCVNESSVNESSVNESSVNSSDNNSSYQNSTSASSPSCVRGRAVGRRERRGSGCDGGIHLKIPRHLSEIFGDGGDDSLLLNESDLRDFPWAAELLREMQWCDESFLPSEEQPRLLLSSSSPTASPQSSSSSVFAWDVWNDDRNFVNVCSASRMLRGPRKLQKRSSPRSGEGGVRRYVFPLGSSASSSSLPNRWGRENLMTAAKSRTNAASGFSSSSSFSHFFSSTFPLHPEFGDEFEAVVNPQLCVFADVSSSHTEMLSPPTRSATSGEGEVTVHGASSSASSSSYFASSASVTPMTQEFVSSEGFRKSVSSSSSSSSSSLSDSTTSSRLAALRLFLSDGDVLSETLEARRQESETVGHPSPLSPDPEWLERQSRAGPDQWKWDRDFFPINYLPPMCTCPQDPLDFLPHQTSSPSNGRPLTSFESSLASAHLPQCLTPLPTTTTAPTARSGITASAAVKNALPGSPGVTVGATWSPPNHFSPAYPDVQEGPANIHRDSRGGGAEGSGGPSSPVGSQMIGSGASRTPNRSRNLRNSTTVSSSSSPTNVASTVMTTSGSDLQKPKGLKKMLPSVCPVKSCQGLLFVPYSFIELPLHRDLGNIHDVCLKIPFPPNTEVYWGNMRHTVVIVTHDARHEALCWRSLEYKEMDRSVLIYDVDSSGFEPWIKPAATSPMGGGGGLLASPPPNSVGIHYTPTSPEVQNVGGGGASGGDVSLLPKSQGYPLSPSADGNAGNIPGWAGGGEVVKGERINSFAWHRRPLTLRLRETGPRRSRCEDSPSSSYPSQISTYGEKGGGVVNGNDDEIPERFVSFDELLDIANSSVRAYKEAHHLNDSMEDFYQMGDESCVSPLLEDEENTRVHPPTNITTAMKGAASSQPQRNTKQPLPVAKMHPRLPPQHLGPSAAVVAAVVGPTIRSNGGNSGGGGEKVVKAEKVEGTLKSIRIPLGGADASIESSFDGKTALHGHPQEYFHRPSPPLPHPYHQPQQRQQQQQQREGPSISHVVVPSLSSVSGNGKNSHPPPHPKFSGTTEIRRPANFMTTDEGSEATTTIGGTAGGGMGIAAALGTVTQTGGGEAVLFTNTAAAGSGTDSSTSSSALSASTAASAASLGTPRGILKGGLNYRGGVPISFPSSSLGGQSSASLASTSSSSSAMTTSTMTSDRSGAVGAASLTVTPTMCTHTTSSSFSAAGATTCMSPNVVASHRPPPPSSQQQLPLRKSTLLSNTPLHANSSVASSPPTGAASFGSSGSSSFSSPAHPPGSNASSGSSVDGTSPLVRRSVPQVSPYGRGGGYPSSGGRGDGGFCGRGEREIMSGREWQYGGRRGRGQTFSGERGCDSFEDFSGGGFNGLTNSAEFMRIFRDEELHKRTLMVKSTTSLEHASLLSLSLSPHIEEVKYAFLSHLQQTMHLSVEIESVVFGVEEKEGYQHNNCSSACFLIVLLAPFPETIVGTSFSYRDLRWKLMEFPTKSPELPGKGGRGRGIESFKGGGEGVYPFRRGVGGCGHFSAGGTGTSRSRSPGRGRRNEEIGNNSSCRVRIPTSTPSIIPKSFPGGISTTNGSSSNPGYRPTNGDSSNSSSGGSSSAGEGLQQSAYYYSGSMVDVNVQQGRVEFSGEGGRGRDARNSGGRGHGNFSSQPFINVTGNYHSYHHLHRRSSPAGGSVERFSSAGGGSLVGEFSSASSASLVSTYMPLGGQNITIAPAHHPNNNDPWQTQHQQQPKSYH